MAMRQVMGSLSDATQVSLARINSDYKDLDIAIVKATNHVESPPKEKHVRTIFAYTAASRPRADVAYCIHMIGKRLGKTKDWIVAIKCLMVIHRTLREGDPTFREELIHFESRGRTLNLTNFKDDSGPAAWDFSAWVRAYALFLEERLECFRVLKYDVEAEKSSGPSATRDLDTPDLLEQLPALQSLLNRLMGCQPEGAAVGSHVIQGALSLVLKESFKLYRAINDGIINLVDKFFEMSRADATAALAIYKRAGEQAERLSQFYDMCKSLELSRSFQFPTLEQPPQTFLQTMEEYVRDAPLNGQPKEVPDERSEAPEPVPEPIPEPEQAPIPEPEPEPPKEPSPPPPPPPPPPAQEADLLDLSDVAGHNHMDPNHLEHQNALALAIVPQEAPAPPSSAFNPNAFSGNTGGWELALVQAPSATNTSVDLQASQKLAGGLDKLTLDSLYEDAVRRSTNYQQGYATSGPVGAPPAPNGVLALPAPPGAPTAFTTVPGGFGGSHDPFAASRQVPPPPTVQMAAMAQQQQYLAATSVGNNSFGAGNASFGNNSFGSGSSSFNHGMPPAGLGMPTANPFANPYGAPTSFGAAPAAQPYAANPFGSGTPTLL